jgi:hypothetical protein
MSRVPAAPAAVLLELNAVGGVPLRLLRLIVTPLALGAGERDRDSDSGCHVFSSFEFPGRLTHRPAGRSMVAINGFHAADAGSAGVGRYGFL